MEHSVKFNSHGYYLGSTAPVWMGPGLVGDDSRASTADACKTIASIGFHLAGRGRPRFCFWRGFNLIREPTAIGETHRDDGPQPSTRLRFSIFLLTPERGPATGANFIAAQAPSTAARHLHRTVLRNTQELGFCQKCDNLSTPRLASGGVSF